MELARQGSEGGDGCRGGRDVRFDKNWYLRIGGLDEVLRFVEEGFCDDSRRYVLSVGMSLSRRDGDGDGGVHFAREEEGCTCVFQEEKESGRRARNAMNKSFCFCLLRGPYIYT